MRRIRWALLIFLGIIPFSVCAQQANTEKPLTDTQKLGQRIFEQRCGICHAPARGAFVMYGPFLYKNLINGNEDAIKEMIWAGEIRAEMLQVMINSRHQAALTRARAGTQQAMEALQANQTLELVAMDLRIATNAVGEIVGKTTTEDLLDSIFSQFCIGK